MSVRRGRVETSEVPGHSLGLGDLSPDLGPTFWEESQKENRPVDPKSLSLAS